MNISLNDYLNGRVKNIWNRQKQMDKEVEAGKIRQSVRPAAAQADVVEIRNEGLTSNSSSGDTFYQ